MSQIIPEFEKLSEWTDIAKRIVEKYPERYAHVNVDKIVAYIVTNKDDADSARPYEMQTDKLPMRLSNPYDYFIWFKSPGMWHDKPQNIKSALVVSALERIDADNPFAVLPLDYRDQCSMVRTFGVDWFDNPKIKDVLEENVQFRV